MKSAPHARSLLVIILSILCLSSQALGRELIGDADGNGVFDLDDAHFLKTQLDMEIVFEFQPGRLSDVAPPCDGRLDHADLFRLERAGRYASERASESTPVTSACHGAEIGTTPPDRHAETSDLPTLDESFSMVAELVPEFAGFYLDSGVPTVALTEARDEILEAAKDALIVVFGEQRMAFEPPYRMVEVRHSFNELTEYRQLARPHFFTESDILTVDTDERRNQIWVGVDVEANQAVVENLLAGSGIPEEAFTIEPVSVMQHSKYQQKIRPILGGRQIDRKQGSKCTMGPIVEISGVRGWLANSHCTSIFGVETGHVMYQADDEDDDGIVGFEADDPFFGPNLNFSACNGYPCRWSDSAFIDVNREAGSWKGRVDVDPSSSVLGYRTFTSVLSHPFVGEPICKSGRTTGYDCGEVTATCNDHHRPGDDEHFLFCQGKATYTSEGGDSGSPVFGLTAGSTAKWLGQNWGAIESPGINWAGLFSPVSGILKDLGQIDALASDNPPEIVITHPMDGSSLGNGNTFSLTLEADYWDDETGGQCPQCDVHWYSNIDGFLGVSPAIEGKASLQALLWGTGPRIITAIAYDSNFFNSVDKVTVTTGNAPPQVWIEWPTLVPNPTPLPPTPPQLWRDTEYVFQADSFDTETFGPLDCNALIWRKGLMQIGTGCYPTLSFSTNGDHLITVTATDAGNLTAIDSISIEVVDPPSGVKPLAQIKEPLPYAALPQNSPVHFEVAGNDPDDASPLTYEWILSGPGLTPTTLHTATANDEESKTFSFVPTDYVYVPCGGRPINLEVKVTDPDSMTDKHSIEATVMRPPC